MLRKVLTENYEINSAELVLNIYHSLEEIQQKLETELAHKQAIIESCHQELNVLRAQVELKDQAIQGLEKKLLESQHSMEGNRQLINKLLNDLERRQQDIDWYKRTYQKRSFLGYLKEYLGRKLR